MIPNLNAIKDDEAKRAFESILSELGGVQPQLLISDGPGIQEPQAHPKQLAIYVDALTGELRAKFGNGDVETLAPLTPWSAVTELNIYDVHLYGAIGDGVADDRAAIQAAAAAAGPGGTVLFRADHTYRISTTITLAYDDQTWWMYGATIAVDFVGAGIRLGSETVRIQRTKIFGGTVQTFSATLDWTAGGIGVKLLNCSNCVVSDVFVRWLEKGIEITSPPPPNASETTQNWIVRPIIASCALPIYLYAEDSGTVNENQFFGGQATYGGSDPSAVGRYAITINHHASSFGTVNGIKFFGTYLGNSKVVDRPNAVYIDAVGCLFDGVHGENFPDPKITFAGDALLGFLPNYLWGGAADWLDPEADLAAGTTGNAAPWVYSGQDGAGVSGGGQAGSDYVWRVKQLGAVSKKTLSVADNTNAETFYVRGDGIVSSGKDTLEGAYRLNGPAASNRFVSWNTAGVARWDARANATAEGGANAGSDWSLNAYTDAGAALITAVTVTRATGAATFGHAVKSQHATAGLGYATGAGGTVTQGTDKTTLVTLNKVTGLITTHNATLNAGTIVSFPWNNSAIAATDLIVIAHESGGTTGAYTVNARATGAGTAAIDLRNNTAGNLTEALVLRFAVLKSVSA